MLQAWYTCICGVLPFFADHLKLCRVELGASLHSYFQVFCRDVQSGSSPGSSWATQGHSEICPEATSALSWLCAYGLCLVERWTFSPVWGPESSGAGFNQGSLYFAPFIISMILTSFPVPDAEKHPHSMMLPPPCFINLMSQLSKYMALDITRFGMKQSISRLAKKHILKHTYSKCFNSMRTHTIHTHRKGTISIYFRWKNANVNNCCLLHFGFKPFMWTSHKVYPPPPPPW